MVDDTRRSIPSDRYPSDTALTIDLRTQTQQRAISSAGDDRFDALFASGTVALARCGPTGELLAANDAFSRDVPIERLRATIPALLAAFETASGTATAKCAVRFAGREVSRTITALGLRDASGAPSELLLTIDERPSAELREFDGGLLTDPLTGLANRTLLLDRIERALAEAERRGSVVTLVLLDLDGFRDVNNSAGLDTGDHLLIHVARQLEQVSRRTDTVARLGGDEFAVLLVMDKAIDPANMAQRALKAVTVPFRSDAATHVATASVGVAVGDATTTGSTLVREAETAMYVAKSKGGNHWSVFETDMHERVARRAELRAMLDDAIGTDQLRLVYQPIFDMTTGKVAALEALLRWQHPELGEIPPAEFVPIAEATGQIVPIGRFVLDRAFERLARWHRSRPGSPLAVHVNVSPRQLVDRAITADVAYLLHLHDLEPASVVLEVTETVLIDDAERVSTVLGHLKALGLRLAIDDYGSGNASISYLRRFPLDVVKIDHSLVHALDERPAQGRAFIESIRQLAATLDLTLVAEGIETLNQRDVLTYLGCPLGQGHALCEPLEADQVADRL